MLFVFGISNELSPSIVAFSGAVKLTVDPLGIGFPLVSSTVRVTETASRSLNVISSGSKVIVAELPDIDNTAELRTWIKSSEQPVTQRVPL